MTDEKPQLPAGLFECTWGEAQEDRPLLSRRLCYAKEPTDDNPLEPELRWRLTFLTYNRGEHLNVIWVRFRPCCGYKQGVDDLFAALRLAVVETMKGSRITMGVAEAIGNDIEGRIAVAAKRLVHNRKEGDV